MKKCGSSDRCRHCGAKLHRVRGILRHYGSFEACLRIQELWRRVRRLERQWRNHACM
jgi:hypothetical protein